MYIENLDDFQPLQNIRIDTSRKVRRKGHVPRMEGGRFAYSTWWGNLKERDGLEELGVDGRISQRSL